MPFFVIRHKLSGHVIPCADGKLGRGGSWVEPVDPRLALPRVFTEKKYAKGWLTSWLKGAMTIHWSVDWESGHQDGRLELVEKPHRKREEDEICPVYFRLGKAVK